MAKGKPNKGQIKPGEVRNPKGGVPLPPAYKDLVNLNRMDMEKLKKFLLTLPVEDLKRVVDDPKENGMKVLICATLIKAIETGGSASMDRLLDRVFGKVPIKLEGNESNPVSLVGIIKLAIS